MRKLKTISGFVAKDCKSIRFFSVKPHLVHFYRNFADGEGFDLWCCNSSKCIQFPLGTVRPSIEPYAEPIKVKVTIEVYE